MKFSKPPENIIIRMPNWLGDLVMATPVIKDIRDHWPQARITVMAVSPICTLLEKDPHIDELFCYSKPKGLERRDQQRKIIDQLSRGKYDLGILLTNSFSSALWFWRGNVKNRIGYSDHYRRFLLNEAVRFPKKRNSQHLVITYKELLDSLGIPLSESAPQIYLTQQEILFAKQRLTKHGVVPGDIVVGINPGAAYGSAKCWLPDRFQKVTEHLLKNPRIRIVFFGDSSGASLVHNICNALPERVINLAGQTSLRELVALIKCCDLFLTNDSGPMHVASALDVPLVALFGSTSDVTTGPYKGGKVIHKHVECSPCYLRTCPIDFRCMKRIEVEEVCRELETIIHQLSNNK